MSKLNLNTTLSGYQSQTSLNSNWDKLEQFADNCLTRDGAAPNFMNAALDMNSNSIINVGDPVNDKDAVNKEWVKANVGTTINVANASQVRATGGTVDRSLANHFGDSISVYDLGCVGDGATDDLPALQAALAAGHRSFYIPANCTVTCNGTLLLSGIVDGVIYKYDNVRFYGGNKATSKIIFTNHDTAYQDNATMKVGIAAYYTVAAAESNGASGAYFQNLTIAGPKKGCTLFWTSGSHLVFNGVTFTTNASDSTSSDRAKYQVVMKDNIRVDFYDVRFGPAYICQHCNIKGAIAGRTTVAANAVYNDDFSWVKCQFYGTSYAAIIDAGSGSEANRTIQNCDFSNAIRYYGYIGNKSITLNYNCNWDEAAYTKVWLTNTDGSSGIMPYRMISTKIPNVIDPDTMNFNDFFLGGWVSGGMITNSHFYNGIRNLDLSGNAGSVLVSGNEYRMATPTLGDKTEHIYVGQTPQYGKVTYLGDYRVYGSVDYEIRDFRGSVEARLTKSTSQTYSGTTYWTSYYYSNDPMAGVNVDAGTGGTINSAFTTKMKIHLSSINPCIRIAGLLCSGTIKAKLHIGAGAAGAPSGYQEVLFNINQSSAGTMTMQYVRTLDQHLQNSYYSLSQYPQMFYGVINNTSNIADQTAIFIGVKGSASNSSAILELEFNCGFVTNRSGTYYRMHPKIGYSNSTDAAAEIAAAEASVAGSTLALADCPMYLNTFTWNPGSLADGAAEVKADITLSGVVVGDRVEVIPPYSLQGIMLTACASAANTVTATLYNKTGGTIDLANSTGWKVINKR